MSLELKGKEGKFGFRYAITGLVNVWKSEWNFRFHVIVMVIVLVFGLLFRLSLLEWALIVIVIAMVLSAELLNTSIEKTIDYIKPEIHPIARFIKDAAAGAVLISSICAVIVGLLIFLPKLVTILF